jgi:hypothetical protein
MGVSQGKDVDEKEARTLRSALLKLLRIWDNDYVSVSVILD